MGRFQTVLPKAEFLHRSVLVGKFFTNRFNVKKHISLVKSMGKEETDEKFSVDKLPKFRAEILSDKVYLMGPYNAGPKLALFLRVAEIRAGVKRAGIV